MFRRIAVSAAAIAVVGLCAATAAFADAGGQGTVTMTQHAHNVVLFSNPTVNPCTGEPGTITAVAANEVQHETFFTAPAADEFWATETDEGTATFTPDDPSGVSASGHFAAWFGISANNRNAVVHDTNNFNLRGSDGSHIVVHIGDQTTMNANGVITVNFSTMKVSCGG
jgi:hypothetical protein